MRGCLLESRRAPRASRRSPCTVVPAPRLHVRRGGTPARTAESAAAPRRLFSDQFLCTVCVRVCVRAWGVLLAPAVRRV